ncbi:MAG: YjiH family protein [Clostridia bacterium]|nr:YjiH family protein [Clostridia bacterium]
MAKDIKTKVMLDPDMPSPELDKITLTSAQKKKGLINFIIFSIIGIFVFFGSIPVNGESTTVFGFLYNNCFLDLFGGAIYWILAVIISANFACHVYFKYIKKGEVKNAFADIYANDTFVHTFLFALGAIYAIIYAAVDAGMLANIEVITGANTGGSVVPPIVKGVLGIILVGAVFMPMLLNYGVLEIIGAILEPLMRPLFKIPGKAALDAVSSFVSSSSLGVMITNRLWKQNTYTDKEMVAIMTGFSAVSIGFAQLVIETAGCGDQFAKIYGLSFVMVFIMAFVMIRIPPINKKSDNYYNGRPQTEEDLKDAKYTSKTVALGFERAIKRAGIARGIGKDVTNSLKDAALVVPQVLTMLSAIGVSAMIIAEYTEVFTWLGYIFQPLLQVLQVPDAGTIAACMPIGIAEMFLPVLIIQGKVATLAYEARAFVCLVSMCQIIFFSETATVMLATKSPISFKEIIICFLERTILAIPLAALCIHLFF